MLKLREKIDQAFWCLSVNAVWVQPFWSVRQKWLYKLFSITMFLITCTVELSLIMAVFFPDKRTGSMQELLYLLFPFTNGLIKYLNVNLKRRKFLELIDMTRDRVGLPRNLEEREISLEYDKIMKFVVTYCFFAAQVPGVTHALMPLMNAKSRKLLANSWFPYDFTETVPFYLTVLLQGLGTLSMASFSMCNDVLTVGLNLHVCTQIRIMCSRMQNVIRKVEEAKNTDVPKERIRRFERIAVRDFVEHHRAIYGFMEKAQSCMNAAILSQYCCGAFLVCFSTYKLTVDESSFYERFSSLAYFLSMVNEMALYCVSGNEVVVENTKIIERLCEENWTVLDTRTLKSMQIIMMRTRKSIEMKCGPMITLSNIAFVKMLKFAYSMFNLVNQNK